MSKKNRQDWLTIPVLPCESILDTLAFWEMLGYKITYKQTKPYQYGVVVRNGYALHFGRVKGMDVSNNTSGCLVMVKDIEVVYADLTEKMKAKMGRVPNSGLPRISRMKPGTTRFTLTDVSGNSIIFINYGEEDLETWRKMEDKNQTPLQRSIAFAINFRDYKDDVNAAVATLDSALRKTENEDMKDIAEALIIRLDLGIFLNDAIRTQECSMLLSQLALTEEQKEKLLLKHNVKDNAL